MKHENGLVTIKMTLLSQLLRVKQTNKFVYNLPLNYENVEERKSEQKLNNTFVNEDLNWKQIYTTPIIATNDIKLREFQYKCLERIIPSKSYLHKCKLVSSSLCDFCNMEVFWMQLKDFLDENQ